jgi:hypothetical protein
MPMGALAVTEIPTHEIGERYTIDRNTFRLRRKDEREAHVGVTLRCDGKIRNTLKRICWNNGRRSGRRHICR